MTFCKRLRIYASWIATGRDYERWLIRQLREASAAMEDQLFLIGQLRAENSRLRIEILSRDTEDSTPNYLAE